MADNNNNGRIHMRDRLFQFMGKTEKALETLEKSDEIKIKKMDEMSDELKSVCARTKTNKTEIDGHKDVHETETKQIDQRLRKNVVIASLIIGTVSILVTVAIAFIK